MKGFGLFLFEIIRNHSPWILRKKYLNRWMVMLIDLITLGIACSLSHAIFYELVVLSVPFPPLMFCLLIALSLGFLVFYTLGVHTGIIRYSGYHEVYKILKAVFFLHLLLYLTTLFLKPVYWKLNLLIVSGSFFFTFFGMLISRLLMISLYQALIHYTGQNRQRTLIWGMDSKRAALADGITKDPSSSLIIVGFISKEKSLSRIRVGRFRMLYLTGQNAAYLLSKHRINAVLFTSREELQAEKEHFVKQCIDAKINIFISPPMEQGAGIDSLKRQIRKIRIEDLLGRDEIIIDTESIGRNLAGKTILITGAAGSIGSELARQIAAFQPARLVLLDIAETPLHFLHLTLEEEFPGLCFETLIGDIRNLRLLRELFRKFRPEIVYHAAAYKHVPMMESNPCEAVMVNVQGTRNLLNCALRLGARSFVMISTDKAVNPSNIMGASKRIAEIYVQSMAKYLISNGAGNKIRCVTTRFGNVLGSNGSVIPHFKEQIEKGGPITVTHPDIIRYFMTIPEACRLVLEAGNIGENGEIYVFDMGEPIKIKDLAERMIALSGLKPGLDIQIKYTGLRPGEKLYEELLNDGENTRPTPHPKIMVADVREYDLRKVGKKLNILVGKAMQVDALETVTLMKEIAPEFISMNSDYEVLDKHRG